MSAIYFNRQTAALTSMQKDPGVILGQTPRQHASSNTNTAKLCIKLMPFEFGDKL